VVAAHKGRISVVGGAYTFFIPAGPATYRIPTVSRGISSVRLALVTYSRGFSLNLHGLPMRSMFALALLFAFSPAFAESAKPSRAQILCKKIAERVGGLKKTCYYDCGAFEGGRSENVYDHCPAWTVRWRLNRNSQFGPHA
jgi:hypothetical protein